MDGSTYKSETKFSGGGVGRNIAEGLHKLNGAVSFISSFGKDQNGDFLRKTLPIETTMGSQISDTSPTANCVVLLDKHGDCKLCVGDMSIHEEITPELIHKNTSAIAESSIICIDSNLPLATIESVLLLAKKYQKAVFYEPTDMSIAHKPFLLSENLFKQIKFISPNLYELRRIAESLNPSKSSSSSSSSDLKIENVHTSDDKEKIFKEIADLCHAIGDRIDNIIVTAGRYGVFIYRSGDVKDLIFNSNFTYKDTCNSDKSLRHYPAQNFDKIVNASGAGDAFISAFITGMLRQKPETICVAMGFEAAKMTLMSKLAVPENFFDRTHPCWHSHAPFNLL